MWEVEVTGQWRAAKGGALRVLFSFDPRRQAILLIGGDKVGRVGRLVRVVGPTR